MGYDYYIDKNLYIFFINTYQYKLINLDHNRCYFYEIDIDSDDEDYKKRKEESETEQLMPSMKPILIYEKYTFSKPIFEEKYKDLILQNLPENKTWGDIKKIMRKEIRYELY